MSRAAGPAGTVTVTVHRGTEVVRVLVEDDGPGFGHVPSGSGLGLPVTRRELEAMGGSLAAGVSCGSFPGPVPDARLPFGDGTRTQEGELTLHDREEATVRYDKAFRAPPRRHA